MEQPCSCTDSTTNMRSNYEAVQECHTAVCLLEKAFADPVIAQQVQALRQSLIELTDYQDVLSEFVRHFTPRR